MILRKLLIVALIGVFVLGGCTGKTDDVEKENIQNENVNEESENIKEELDKGEQEEIMAQYNKVIEQDKPLVVKEFVNKNIEKVSEENAGKMILGLEEVQNAYMDEYMNALFEDDIPNKLHEIFGVEFDKEKVDSIEDQELKELLTEILEGGYQIVSLEGDFYPMMNYSPLEKYTQYLSDDMKDYIEIMATEYDALSFKDAHLAISWDELAERTINTEKYLSKYEDSPKREDIGKMYINYIRAYIHPIADYTTEKISDETINAYKKVVDEYEETVTAEVTKEYLEILEKNDYKPNEETQEESDRLFNKALETLNLEDNM